MTSAASAFVYDLDQLAAWSRRIRASVPAAVELYYACKANPLSHVLSTLAASGFGFDVASPGELRQAARAASGLPLIATGPAKTEAFLNEALALGVRRFVVESRGQLEALEKASERAGARVTALLRLQLRWDGGESVLGGASVSAFGLDPEGWREALREFSPRFVTVQGVHVFQWGNETDLSRLEEIWARVVEESLAFARDAGFPLRVLDLGGGLGLPYGEGELIAPEALGSAMRRIEARLPASRLLLELGRYAVGPCGTYRTTVVDRKEVRGESFLLVAGGAHHLLRPALVGQPFPARLVRESSATLKEFRVHGPLCTALDKLGTFALPSDCAPGDRLELAYAGAYGFTESMPFFLCHEGAAELVRKNGELRLVRGPLRPEDWLL